MNYIIYNLFQFFCLWFLVTDEERDCSFELANEKRDFPADEAMLEISIREDFTRTVPFTTNLNINGNRVLVTVDKQNSHSQKIDITQIFNSWSNEEVYEKLRVSVEDESVLAVDVLDDSSEHVSLVCLFFILCDINCDN